LGSFGVTDLHIGVQLEGLTDEDQRDDAIEIEGAAEVLGVRGLGGFVVETAGGGRGDAVHEAVDEGAGLVLLGQAEGEAAHGLGDVESLDVVVMVMLDGQTLVDQGARRFVEGSQTGLRSRVGPKARRPRQAKAMPLSEPLLMRTWAVMVRATISAMFCRSIVSSPVARKYSPKARAA
jgi:hypothetical protein